MMWTRRERGCRSDERRNTVSTPGPGVDNGSISQCRAHYARAVVALSRHPAKRNAGGESPPASNRALRPCLVRVVVGDGVVAVLAPLERLHRTRRRLQYVEEVQVRIRIRTPDGDVRLAVAVVIALAREVRRRES